MLSSALTFFSGFGLGTVLMPVMAVFFPVETAIALTAVVHFLNNIFKLLLVGKKANAEIVIRFGIPAALCAFIGAWTLTHLAQSSFSVSYDWLAFHARFTPEKFIISLIMIIFAVWDFHPRLSQISFDRKYLSFGGVLSGFLGGLSGHQGALRSAFLIRCELAKEAFIASGVVIACMVDVMRLGVYLNHFSKDELNDRLTLIITATVCAFIGAFLGNRWLSKMTLRSIQILVALMLFLIAIALGAGLI